VDGQPEARRYPDLQDHLAALEAADLVWRIDEPINKDTEIHTLARWMFRGGLPESERKAFLFTHVTDAKGRNFDIPVLVGGLAANPEIYRIGMGVPLDKIGETWTNAIAHPIEPVVIDNPACQEVVFQGADLIGEGKGLDMLPVPISSPGFDVAPYLTAANFVTVDPEDGVQNLGTYRGGLKASNRMAVRMSTRPGGAGGYVHWQKYQALGDKKMPCTAILGAPPAVAFCGPQKLPQGLDELRVAGGLVGEPIRVTKCLTNDLMIPADCEIVIEGFVDTEFLEPEAPFGESHGHLALEDYNMIFEVTAITMKRKPVFNSIISQVTPSESSVIKRVAYEPMFLNHLRNTLGIKSVQKVVLHEPLTNIRRVIFVVMEPGTSKTEIWRALNGAAFFRADCGKIVIAVNEDIDPNNADSVFWSMAYRCNPIEDIQIIPYRDGGHGPKGGRHGSDSTMLVDATLKADMPPLALPKKPHMEHAKDLWDRLGLPPLKPEMPWFGYSLGDWTDEWDDMAATALAGDYMENGRRTQQQQISGVKPETPVRNIQDIDKT